MQTAILQSILDSMGDGVIVADQQGKIFMMNPAARLMHPTAKLGAEPAEYAEAYDLVLPDKVTPYPTEELPLVRVLRGETVDHQEVLVRSREAPEGVWTSVTGRPLRDAHGRQAGGVIVIHDETDRMAAEQALLAGQEAERQRIAQELHDSICQSLCVLIVKMQRLAESCPDTSREVRGQLLAYLEEMERVTEEVGRVSRRLHPNVLKRLGLIEALRRLCAEFGESQAVRVDFSPGALPDALPEIAELALYRIAQESLGNASKHSGAAWVAVSLEYRDGAAQLTVQDRGEGFDVEKVAEKGRLGLTSMQERARLAGGSVTVDSTPGSGTKVTARIPIGAGS